MDVYKFTYKIIEFESNDEIKYKKQYINDVIHKCNTVVNDMLMFPLHDNNFPTGPVSLMFCIMCISCVTIIYKTYWKMSLELIIISTFVIVGSMSILSIYLLHFIRINEEDANTHMYYLECKKDLEAIISHENTESDNTGIVWVLDFYIDELKLYTPQIQGLSTFGMIRDVAIKVKVYKTKEQEFIDM